MADFDLIRTDGTLTLAQYRALDLKRPLTDKPTGWYSGERRKVDADCSALFREAGIAQPGWTAPPRHERTDV